MSGQFYTVNNAGYFLGGQGYGAVGGLFANGRDGRFDPGLERPYIDYDGHRKVNIRDPEGRMVFNKELGEEVPRIVKRRVSDLRAEGHPDRPVWNAATLTKDAWIKLDQTIVKSTRNRLRAYADLLAANPVSGFNGMATTMYEYMAMSDEGEAQVSMTASADQRQSRPVLALTSIPLPITAMGFYFDQRQLASSKGTGMPLDTTMAEMAGRRVAEMIEQTTIGTVTGVTAGPTNSGDARYRTDSKVYGYTNFTYRVTKTDLTTPDGTNPDTVLQDVIEMRETMYTNGFYGPFVLYTSTSYDQWLDRAHFVGTFAQGLTSQARTLREAIEAIDGISSVRRLDFLTSGYQMILVQMTSEVAQAVNAMDVTTIQWEEKGGTELHFRVLAIQVPLLKAPYSGTSGVIHGTTS